LESAAPTPPPASPPAGIKPEKISPLPTKKLSPADSLHISIKPDDVVALKRNTVVQIDQIESADYYNKIGKGYTFREVPDAIRNVHVKFGDSKYLLIYVLKPKKIYGDSKNHFTKDDLTPEALTTFIRFRNGQEMSLLDVLNSEPATYFYESGNKVKGKSVKDGNLVLSNVKNVADYNKLISDTRYKIEQLPGTKDMQVSFPDGGYIVLEDMYSNSDGFVTKGIDFVIIPNGAGDGLKIPIADFVAKKPINNA